MSEATEPAPNGALDRLLPPLPEAATPPAPPALGPDPGARLPERLPAHLARLLAEAPGPDRSAQLARLVAAAVEYGLPDQAILALAWHHQPTLARARDKGTDINADVTRLLGKLRPRHPHEGRPCDAAGCPHAPAWMTHPHPSTGRGAQPAAATPPAAGTGGAGRPEAPAERLTDLGNAERLVARHGRDLRYCHPWDKWLVWDGRRWAVDDTAEVTRRAADTVRSIYHEAAAQPDPAARRATAAWAQRSEAAARIRAMVGLASALPGIPVLPEALDADPWRLTVANGTVDLRAGTLRPHRRADLATKLAPVAFDPHATAPRWEAFLGRVMGGNLALIEFLQRAVGYSLTGLTSEQVLFLLHGTGANGKSVFVRVLLGLLGDYAQQLATSTLLARRDHAIPNDLAALRGIRLATASETERGNRLAEGLLKQLTGGDRLRARFLRAEFFEFTPTAKLWLATNHRPDLDGADPAIWRRVLLVPFEVTIPEPEQDRQLTSKLAAEASGILRWAVDGCLAWQRHGLAPPAEVRAATEAYRADQASGGVASFLEDCCEPDPAAWTPFATLYGAYQAWCHAAGVAEWERLSQKRFAVELTALGYRDERRGHDKTRGRVGLRLRAARSGPRPDPAAPERPAHPTDSGEVRPDAARSVE